jgi:hypothetical protein
MYDIYRSTADDACRFVLGRSVRRPLVVVGLNPSTATRERSDPTAAKMERVARASGYDGFVLVTLCPVRVTDSRTLPATVDGKLLAANLRAIVEVVGAAVAIAEHLQRFGPAWQHFGPLTVGGHPWHPSRLSYAWRFAPFDVAAYLEVIHGIAADSGLDAVAAGSRNLRPSSQ